MNPALPAFGELSAFALMWGILTLISLLVAIAFWFINHSVGKLPLVGSLFTTAAHRVEQYISNKITDAIVKMEHRIWHSWYQLAHLTEWVGREIAAHANVLTVLANLIANPGSIAAWRAAINGAHTAINGVAGSIGGKVHGLTKPWTARLARLEHRTHLWYLALHFAIAVTIPGELLNLRHRNRSLTDSITNAWKLLKKHERLLGLASMTGVVAVVLSRLGLSWIRCGKLKTRGPALCNLADDLFQALLLGATAIFGAISLATFAHLLIDAMDEFVGAVQGFVRELHGVPARSAAAQGFEAPGGSIAFRSAGDQGFA